MNEAETIAILAVMDAAWPSRGLLDDRGLPSSAGLIYAAKISGLEYRDVQAGVDHLIGSSTFPPAVAEVLAAAHLARTDRELANQTRMALEAPRITEDDADAVTRLIQRFRRRHAGAPPATDVVVGRRQEEVRVGAALEMTDAERAERRREFDRIVEEEERAARQAEYDGDDGEDSLAAQAADVAATTEPSGL